MYVPFPEEVPEDNRHIEAMACWHQSMAGGTLCYRRGDLVAAEAYFCRALEVAREMLDCGGQRDQAATAYVLARHSLADTLERGGRSHWALHHWFGAHRKLELLFAEAPSASARKAILPHLQRTRSAFLAALSRHPSRHGGAALPRLCAQRFDLH
ncbi:hypothetical protein [Zoogloea sp.]|uniref:hypothetical protein n=1 Tax=Zoogloea sp. TaxID=49181 RepID=UPI001AD4368E|nr:hypothetical protein [Zoogloea sp.]MBN8284209.1 hypothetical protein [Zoogloea sp.]